MQLTDEQQPIIDYEGKHLVVKAFAGCGKTSTLVAYAQARPNQRILYLAYNRAIRDEGATKFPKNVACKTSHQLAWPEYGSRYQHKLGNLRLTDIAQHLKTRNWSLIKAAQATLNAFLSSADEVIDVVHAQAGMECEAFINASEDYLLEVVEGARSLWESMTDPSSQLSCVHDAYLKLYQLSKPILPYDTILFDEAQDANPLTSALVAGQSAATKIFVGDQWQQIYRWRGAENALDQQIEAGADVMHLTNSFRFGPLIAGAANVILRAQGETRRLIGRGAMDQVLTTLHHGTRQYTVLNRTVAGVIQTAIEEVERGKTIYWNGGIESYQVSDIEDLHNLRVGNKDAITNPKLAKQFPTFAQYEKAAEETKDPEMIRMLKILKDHPSVPRLLSSLRKNMALDAEDADVVVSTAHRAKGLEWDTVVLENDFPETVEQDYRQMDSLQRSDELNLLYVAATRAMKTLVINAAIEELILKMHAEARRARASVHA